MEQQQQWRLQRLQQRWAVVVSSRLGPSYGWGQEVGHAPQTCGALHRRQVWAVALLLLL
jgi:hypothetical protein